MYLNLPNQNSNLQTLLYTSFLYIYKFFFDIKLVVNIIYDSLIISNIQQYYKGYNDIYFQIYLSIIFVKLVAFKVDFIIFYDFIVKNIENIKYK